VLAANDPGATDWLPGVAVVADRLPDAGGLGGVDAVLASGSDALIVAWDMPFVTVDVLRVIVDRARRASADVVVPQSESPFGFEPFCAFYSARAGAPLSRFLAAGGRAPSDFLARLTRVERIPQAELPGDARRLFLSVNTPEDLATARAAAERGT